MKRAGFSKHSLGGHALVRLCVASVGQWALNREARGRQRRDTNRVTGQLRRMEAKRHGQLRALPARQRALLLDSIEQQLVYEPLTETRNRKPVAAIVSLSKVDKESLSLSTSPEFMEIIEKARVEFAAGKRLTLEEMKREVLG